MPDNKKRPNPVDVHVGARIRLRRNMVGLSQERLGDSLGITFQQIQKYEKGVNRVGASRLQAIGNVLNVPVTFFFDDMPDRSTHGLTAISSPMVNCRRWQKSPPAWMAASSSRTCIISALTTTRHCWHGMRGSRPHGRNSHPNMASASTACGVTICCAWPGASARAKSSFGRRSFHPRVLPEDTGGIPE